MSEQVAHDSKIGERLTERFGQRGRGRCQGVRLIGKVLEFSQEAAYLFPETLCVCGDF
ncbi:hypothetical protein [Streptomyces chartreusis]|uniref:hypothetical protein n=1 Tax=Streptomyces chartreusis TaxID=1969 RepID=UPI0037FB1902